MKHIDNKNRIKDLWNFLTVPSGRLRRRDNLMIGFCLIILFVLFTIIWAPLLSITSSNPLFFILLVLFWLIVITVFWISVVTLIKRIQDIGINQLWGIFLLIPYFNIIAGLFFLLKDGTIGPNKYGADPKGRKIEKSFLKND